jgi:hypothetical protein
MRRISTAHRIDFDPMESEFENLADLRLLVARRHT